RDNGMNKHWLELKNKLFVDAILEDTFHGEMLFRIYQMANCFWSIAIGGHFPIHFDENLFIFFTLLSFQVLDDVGLNLMVQETENISVNETDRNIIIQIIFTYTKKANGP
ncbi:hypothetical protein ACJX0J_018778, partial [Zea mays]